MWNKKKCVVLDLDETLIYTAEDLGNLEEFNMLYNAQYYDVRSKLYLIELDDAVDLPGSGNTSILCGCYRPYIHEFLVFCSNYFDKTIVWSAGRKKYVHAICNDIFKGLPGPHDILTWDDCEFSGSEGFVTKPLTKLFAKHPDLNFENTVAIDDRKTTFSIHNPNNGILIPPYIPNFTPDFMRTDKDESLLDLIMYLNTTSARNYSTVAKVTKNSGNIWTTPDIKLREDRDSSSDEDSDSSYYTTSDEED